MGIERQGLLKCKPGVDWQLVGWDWFQAYPTGGPIPSGMGYKKVEYGRW